MAMEADLSSIVDSSGKQKLGLKKIVPRWHRRMMLTPCAVATFASLPGKMVHSRYLSVNRYATEYLFNFIDVLIVDEAGQALPEVAGASFALAKRALVIGDTQQIEPISSVPMPVDLGNLRDCGLLEDTKHEDAVAVIVGRGLASKMAVPCASLRKPVVSRHIQNLRRASTFSSTAAVTMKSSAIVTRSVTRAHCGLCVVKPRKTLCYRQWAMSMSMGER